MEIKWDEAYCMGIDTFDNEHQQLFRIAQRMVDYLEDGGIEDRKKRMFVIREGNKYLKAYWKRHALEEEEYMRKIGHPDYNWHKKAHDDFYEHQLRNCDQIIESSICSKEEVLEFMGKEIGWLLEHITTMDLAIVGKGYLSTPKVVNMDQEILVEQLNQLFKATLNIDLQAHIVDDHYRGGKLQEAMFHEINYEVAGEPLTLFVGIEKRFAVEIIRKLYDGEIADYEAMILATFDVFGVNFWKTFGIQILGNQEDIKFVDSHIRITHHIREMFAKNQPKVSYLLNSEKGQFFLASNQVIIKK